MALTAKIASVKVTIIFYFFFKLYENENYIRNRDVKKYKNCSRRIATKQN